MMKPWIEIHFSNCLASFLVGHRISVSNGATLLAAMELARVSRPQSKAERKRLTTLCIKKVAKKLGNTPAMARSSYIDPRIFTTYDSSDTIAEIYKTVKTMKPRAYLSTDERWVMKLLAHE